MSNNILTQLRVVAEDLTKLKVKWALVGGLAVSVHGEPRTTRDIDISVAVGDREKQDQLIKSLLNLGYSGRQVLMHLMPTHRLGERLIVRGGATTSLPLDLLFTSSGIEPEVVDGAVPIEIFPGLSIPVVQLGHLLAMKILSQNDDDRLRDRLDAASLIVAASDSDLALTRKALELMTARGFNRGRDLDAVFTQELARCKKFKSTLPEPPPALPHDE